MIINDSYWLTFVHHLKEQSLPILEEQIRANKNNHKELLKLMMLFVYTYYKQSDHATLDEKKSCQNVMRLIEGYEPQGTVDDLEEVYVLYSQLVLDIEWGVECTHWEPLGNDKTINPSIDKMKERKHALEKRLEGASQIPDEQLATIDLAALARKISSSPSNNLEELYLFVRAYYYNHSSGEPAKEEEINKAYHASLYKVLHYTLKSMKEYRAYNYLLLLIDRGGDRAQQHCPLAYFHSINPDLASTVDISIDDALTLKLNKLQVRNHEFDSTMYLSFFEGSFQNEDDFKKLCADIEQFKTKFNNTIIAAQLYHSTYFRMKNSNTALTGKNVLDTINRFQKILPPVFNISNTSPQWKYYNEKLAWLQLKCE